jgi:hypothetical protein
MKHPSETDLALFAGGDCGWWRHYRLTGHVSRCGDCRDVVASFAELRSEVREYPAPELDWDGMAGRGGLEEEMRANIRVGLAAGECVRETPASASHRGFSSRLAVGMASVVLLAGVGLFLRGLLPHESAPGVANAAVLESTGAGVEVRTGSGNSMTLLNHGDVAGNQSVTSQGAISASYVDAGTVTVTSVYVE